MLKVLVVILLFSAVQCLPSQKSIEAKERHVMDYGRTKRGAALTAEQKWPKDKPIPYELDAAYTPEEKHRIRKVLATFAENTCLEYGEDFRGYDDFDKLKFVRGDGCSSIMGFHIRNSDQNITIGKVCSFQDIQHEVTHSLGFHHTQQRPDRDEYVIVAPREKAKNGSYYITNPPLSKYNSFHTYDIPYEYGSLMHYSNAREYSIDGATNLIYPRKSEYFNSMGGANEMTFYDWKLVNSHYQCRESCPNYIKCFNGGYQHPRHCELCFCPRYFIGDFCEYGRNEKQLTRTGSMKLEFHEEAGPPGVNDGFQNYRKSTIHLITAPLGCRIRVVIERINFPANEFPGSQCGYAAVELARDDLSAAGIRYCHNNVTGTEVLTPTNRVGYRAFALAGHEFDSRVTFEADCPSDDTTTHPNGTTEGTEGQDNKNSTLGQESRSREGSGVPIPDDDDDDDGVPRLRHA